MSALLIKITGFFGVFTGDIVFIVTIFVILLAYGLYFGSGRLVSVVIAFYPATLLYSSFPFIAKLTILHGDKLLVLNKLIIFMVFLIPLNIIINRYIFSAGEYSSTGGIFRNAGLSLAGVILVVAFSYSTVNYDVFHDFSPLIDNLFAGTDRIFYWNLAPIALLTVL